MKILLQNWRLNTYCELLMVLNFTVGKLSSDILMHSTIVYLIISCYNLADAHFITQKVFIKFINLQSLYSFNYLSFNHFVQ